MDSESKQLLQNMLALAEENNKMLLQIRKVQKRGTLWRVLKLVVIIGVTLGAFHYVEPYLNKVMDFYDSVSGMEKNIKDVSDSTSSFQDLLKKL